MIHAASFRIGCILMLAGAHAIAQKVDTAYVWKYDLYDQTSNAAPRYSGSLLTAGFQLVDPITIVSSANTLISGRSFSLSPASLSLSGMTVSASTFSYSSRALLDQFFPNDTLRFEYKIPAVFDGSIELSGDRYPAAVQVSNFTELQAVAGSTAVVEWPRLPTALPGDIIMVSVRDREEFFSAVGVNASGVADYTATSATVGVPSGQPVIGTITVLRLTATGESAGGKLVAGYATSTSFPIRSISPRDDSAPQVVSRSPNLDVVGADPGGAIELVFDKPMRPRGLLRGLSSPAGKRQRLTWSADQRSVRIDFPAPLPAGLVELTFDNEIGGQAFEDLSGNIIPGGALAARFFVGNLPVFTSQPTSVTPNPGSTVTLTGAALWPAGGVSYQWFLDGVAVSGATDATLLLPNFQMARSGVYELRATNANGSTFSAPAVVAIDAFRFLPRASIRPSVEAVYPFKGDPITPGLPLTLSVAMEFGSTASSMQWRKNGEAIPGATRMTLDFPSLRESDSGYYDILLVNDYGPNAPPGFQLNVRPGAPLPKYTLVPQDVTIKQGDTAGLLEPGQTPYGYLRGWLRNGQPLPTPETTTSLSLRNIAPADAGVYRYFVSNGVETVIAAEYTVSVRQATKAPTITVQPQDVWFTEDAAASIAPHFDGEFPFTFQWRKNGADLPGATGLILVFLPNKPEQAGTYTCVVRNAYGAVETRPFNVRLWSAHVAPEKPKITGATQRTLGAGGILNLDSDNDFSPAPPRTYEWRRGGITIPSQGRYLQIANLRATDSGTYSVVYANSYGASESDPVEVRVLDESQPPTLAMPRITVTARLGEAVDLTSPFVALGNPRYRWFVNGRDVTMENARAVPGQFTIGSVQSVHAGLWSVEVTNAAGSATAPVAELILAPEPPSSARLANVSTRATAGRGNATLIVGFGISGSQAKRMLLRAIGPSLATFGVTTPAKNPRLTVYRGTTVVASNDDWYRQSGVAALVTAQRTAGAFPLGADAVDAAVIMTLEPGAYTLQYVNDAPNGNEIGLIEAYDLDPGLAPARLTNLSSRLFVGPGEQAAIPGLVVTGVGTRTYLIRAIGPGLKKFGVDGALSDPVITLKAGLGSFATFSNDDWEKSANPAALSEAAERVGAFALDKESKDSALLATLNPGNYTALVSGAGNSAGVALVEIYEIPR